MEMRKPWKKLKTKEANSKSNALKIMVNTVGHHRVFVALRLILNYSSHLIIVSKFLSRKQI